LKTLQGFGIGRLATMIGVGGGAAAVLIALLLRLGGEPMSLLYSNVDLKEAGQITAALDQANIKYELKGDGSTILAPRDKVAQARLLLSGKGLPTSGSVGYEIFDNAPALGQTDFVQNLNRQRALEGELARTIRGIRGVSAARVHLVLPKRQLFEDDEEAPSASIMVAVTGRPLSPEQVRAIRNLAASAVPNLKADKVTVVDEAGELLAGGGEEGGGVLGGAGGGQRAETEERIKKTVKDLVEGVVGPGKARVQVSAEIDTTRVTLQEEKFDPDGQVVRSTQTSQQNANETRPGSNNAVSASQNLPGAQAAGAGGNANSTSGENNETTNYEISKTTRTEVQEPGAIKKLSVAVAVDGVTAPGKDGKPGPYTPRTAQEMQRIEQLVRSAVGFDQGRGDVVSVVNVQFDRRAADGEGVTAASPFSFDKNDIMRGGELGVMALMVVLIILFVVRPMLKPPAGAGTALALAGAAPGAGGVPVTQLQIDPATGQPAPMAALAAPDGGIDISRIEGQVKASSVRQVAEFVEKHPEESVSILRSWLHEA
jgi:flagellar M-ring protein FliF